MVERGASGSLCGQRVCCPEFDRRFGVCDLVSEKGDEARRGREKEAWRRATGRKGSGKEIVGEMREEGS